MEQPLTLHIVDSDSRSRAEQARTAFALGHHAEVYSDLAELLDRRPTRGVLLLRERSIIASLGDLFERLGDVGVWLPVVVCAEEPRIGRVVAAIKGGALDYLQLPLEAGRLSRSLARVVSEAEAYGRVRHRLADARRRVSQLSKRELQVIELLAHGGSNKVIARELSISPRTVEIHRAKMMAKLRASHAAEAVRLWLEAGLETRRPPPFERRESAAGLGVMPYHDLVQKVRERMPEVVGEEDGHVDESRQKRAQKRRAGSL